jgi:hypothetical protein
MFRFGIYKPHPTQKLLYNSTLYSLVYSLQSTRQKTHVAPSTARARATRCVEHIHHHISALAMKLISALAVGKDARKKSSPPERFLLQTSHPLMPPERFFM